MLKIKLKTKKIKGPSSGKQTWVAKGRGSGPSHQTMCLSLSFWHVITDVTNWVSYEYQTLISHRFGGHKSKVMMLAGSVSAKNLPSGSKMAVFSLCHHMAEGAKEQSGIPF